MGRGHYLDLLEQQKNNRHTLRSPIAIKIHLEAGLQESPILFIYLKPNINSEKIYNTNIAQTIITTRKATKFFLNRRFKILSSRVYTNTENLQTDTNIKNCFLVRCNAERQFEHRRQMLFSDQLTFLLRTAIDFYCYWE